MTLSEAIEILNRRSEHLRQRIEASPKELSFDRAEMGAIRLAVNAMIERRDAHSKPTTAPKAN